MAKLNCINNVLKLHRVAHTESLIIIIIKKDMTALYNILKPFPFYSPISLLYIYMSQIKLSPSPPPSPCIKNVLFSESNVNILVELQFILYGGTMLKHTVFCFRCKLSDFSVPYRSFFLSIFPSFFHFILHT